MEIGKPGSRDDKRKDTGRSEAGRRQIGDKTDGGRRQVGGISLKKAIEMREV